MATATSWGGKILAPQVLHISIQYRIDKGTRGPLSGTLFWKISKNFFSLLPAHLGHKTEKFR